MRIRPPAGCCRCYTGLVNGAQSARTFFHLCLRKDVPHINDLNLHQVLTTRIVESGAVDAWVPQWGSGSAMLRYYQNLPHVLAAALAILLRIPPATAVVLLHALFLGGFPWALARGLRTLGAPSAAGSLAAFLSLFVALDPRQRYLYGLSQTSFTWDGWGLFPTLAAATWLALAWGHMYQWVAHGRNFVAAALFLSCTCLSHLAMGIGALVSSLALLLFAATELRSAVLRLLALFAAVGGSVAYLLLPLHLEPHLVNRASFEGREFYEGLGLKLFRFLARGFLFDDPADRVGGWPWFSLLLALGCAVALVRFLFAPARAHDQGTASALSLVCMLSIGVALTAGRELLGPLVNLLPLAPGLPLHRFFMLVHLVGIMLAGWSASQLYAGLRSLLSTLLGSKRAAALVLAVVLIGIAATSMPGHVDKIRGKSAMIVEQRAHLESDWGVAIANMMALVEERTREQPGRAYGGTRWNWGDIFDVRFVKIYAMWTAQHRSIPNVGFLWHSAGLMSDIDFFFNESRVDHHRLFNVRYLLCSLGTAPYPAQRISNVTANHAVHLWPNADGYFGFINIGGCFDRWNKTRDEDFQYRQASVLGSMHASSLHDRIALFEDDRCSPDELFTSQSPTNTAVQTQRGNLDTFSAVVTCGLHEGCTLMLRVTYHPNFVATLNGEPVPTFAVSPMYLALRVPFGAFNCVVRYQSPRWSVFLTAASLGWLALLFVLLLAQGASARGRGGISDAAGAAAGARVGSTAVESDDDDDVTVDETVAVVKAKVD